VGAIMTFCPERITRSAVLPGAVVALAALMGMDGLATAPIERLHRSTTLVAHAVPLSRPAFRSPSANLTGIAATILMVVVLLRRSPDFACWAVITCRLAASSASPWALCILQRKFRMSYRTGGRYAP
jgi:hypothetical protein